MWRIVSVCIMLQCLYSLSLSIYVCFLYLSWRSVVQLILLSEEKYVCERCFHITTDSDKD